jgi:hypothetical protein
MARAMPLDVESLNLGMNASWTVETEFDSSNKLEVYRVHLLIRFRVESPAKPGFNTV